MAVDRHGAAFILFTDGNMYRSSVADASCEPTGYEPDQLGFHSFGMGFATAMDEPEDELFVAHTDFVEPSKGLGVRAASSARRARTPSRASATTRRR